MTRLSGPARDAMAIWRGRRARSVRACTIAGWTLAAAMLMGPAGCTSYRFGPQSLYRPDIATVYVPMFQSDSFRRFLGERLTEAVIKEIEWKTPYKVVNDPNADSTLSGRIVGEYKRPIAEDLDGWPRDIEVGLLVEVSWRDRGGEILGQQTVVVPEAPTLLAVGQATQFIPEGGQSLEVALQETVAGLAEQIVSEMESPW